MKTPQPWLLAEANAFAAHSRYETHSVAAFPLARWEILELIIQGMRTKRLAYQLASATRRSRTTSYHLGKLGVADRTQAAVSRCARVDALTDAREERSAAPFRDDNGLVCFGEQDQGHGRNNETDKPDRAVPGRVCQESRVEPRSAIGCCQQTSSELERWCSAMRRATSRVRQVEAALDSCARGYQKRRTRPSGDASSGCSRCGGSWRAPERSGKLRRYLDLLRKMSQLFPTGGLKRRRRRGRTGQPFGVCGIIEAQERDCNA